MNAAPFKPRTAKKNAKNGPSLRAIERALLLINDALRLQVVELEGMDLKIGSRVFVQHASFEGKVVAETENTVKVLHADTPGYCVWFAKRDVELIGVAT